jgi:hypothetical protein
MSNEGWIEAETFVNLTRANGYEIGRGQLARWHRAGLLPKPKTAPRPQGRGTRTLYPPGSDVQLLALCVARGRGIPYPRLAWRLWWQGFAVDFTLVRRFTIGAAQTFDRERGELRLLLADPDGLFDLSEEAAEVRLPGGSMRRARKRVGRDRFSTVVRVMMEIAAGTFTGYSEDWSSGSPSTAEEQALVEKALGFKRGRTDRVAAADPWLQGDTGVDLAKLSSALAAVSAAEIAAAVDEDRLAVARDFLRELTATLGALADLGEAQRSRGAFGAPAFRDLGRLHDRDQALMVTLLAASPAGALDIDESWTEAFAAFDRGQHSYTLLQDLAREVPELSDLLTPKRLGLAQRSPAHAARHEARLRERANQHRAAVDAFFAKHADRLAAIERAE